MVSSVSDDGLKEVPGNDTASAPSEIFEEGRSGALLQGVLLVYSYCSSFTKATPVSKAFLLISTLSDDM